jgi:hypothetical protein
MSPILVLLLYKLAQLWSFDGIMTITVLKHVVMKGVNIPISISPSPNIPISIYPSPYSDDVGRHIVRSVLPMSSMQGGLGLNQRHFWMDRG